MRIGNLLTCCLTLVLVSVSDADAYLAAGCANQQYSAADIAQAIQNSPTANSTLQSNSCNFGGAGLAESGGNTCESNGNNFGVLQLTRSKMVPAQTASQARALLLRRGGQR